MDEKTVIPTPEIATPEIAYPTGEKKELLPLYEQDVKSAAPHAAAVPTTPQTPHLNTQIRSSHPQASPTATSSANMGIHTTSPQAASSSRPIALVLGAAALLWFFLTATGGLDFSGLRSESRPIATNGAGSEALANKRLVPLEAHIMSKCPDTKVRPLPVPPLPSRAIYTLGANINQSQACLKELVLPAMERVSSKVAFQLSFLGRSTDNDGVECMHGPSECLGNILLLCAAHLYPTPLALPFAMCLENEYQDIPDETLVRQCALEHAVNFDRINDCASDEALGIGLLRDSVERTTSKSVTKSCTVRLNEEVYCIHDGTWKECPKGPGVNDLVIEIEKLYRSQEF